MGVRISNITETTTMADANTLPTDTTSGTRRISWANLKTAIFGAINGLTSKSTPVGADVIAIGDSAASFAGKKTTIEAAVRAGLTGWTVAWDTYAGVGGTDTKIIYFTNKNTDTSSGDLTIVNNSTNGLRLTIVSDGLYAISHSLAVGGASLVFGLSRNSNQLTTDIGSITAAHRLAIATINTDYSATVAVTLPLSAGDVIRPHFGAGAGNASAYAALASFRITRIR